MFRKHNHIKTYLHCLYANILQEYFKIITLNPFFNYVKWYMMHIRIRRRQTVDTLFYMPNCVGTIPQYLDFVVYLFKFSHRLYTRKIRVRIKWNVAYVVMLFNIAHPWLIVLIFFNVYHSQIATADSRLPIISLFAGLTPNITLLFTHPHFHLT